MSSPANIPIKLIGSVRVVPDTARPGEPVLIQVLDPGGQPYSPDSGVTITINGVAAGSRYCQFLQPGTRPISIRAMRGKVTETASVNVDVQGDPLAFRLSAAGGAPAAMPILRAKLDPTNPYVVIFALGTPDSVKRVAAEKRSLARTSDTAGIAETATLRDQVEEIAGKPQAGEAVMTSAKGSKVTVTSWHAPISPANRIAPAGGASYEWDFGDGRKATTASPNVSHNYYPAIRGDQTVYNFDVECTVVHDSITVRRTLVLHSAYGLCRRFGNAVPHVTGDTHATFERAGFAAAMILSNPEPAATMTLTRMAVVPVGADKGAAMPAPVFTDMTEPITIAAGSSSGLGVYVSPDQLSLDPRGPAGEGVTGFTVYYNGEMTGANAGGTVPVRFSRHFRVRQTDLRAARNSRSAGPAANTRGFAIAPAADPHSASTLANVRTAVQAGSRAEAVAPAAAPAPAPIAPVQAGANCDPENISAADAASAGAQQLSCQLTGQAAQVPVPGGFQNAQMGDVVLVPGDNGTIGQLLRALTPPQAYSHSGIMTQNHVEITHCTTSEDRYGDYMKGLLGAGGVQPDVLQYGWPGSVTQTVDNAINGQSAIDTRNGNAYEVQGFVSEAPPEFSLVPPLVIKPLPENETVARPMLRMVAATARSKGAQIDDQANITFQGSACYYSFYGYSNPQIGLGFGDPAPADAKWAVGLTPGVCSSFLWLCMKANGIGLMGASQYATTGELSPTAVSEGAEVDATTLDGLFFYPAADRLGAATQLETIFENMALDKEGFFAHIPLLGSGVASAIADQVVNMFVFGNPNQYGSKAWENPGTGNAVSPWNISWWNQPLFGWSEPAQYLQPHTELSTSSVWTAYAGTGSISGTVTLDGQAKAGAEVQVYDGLNAITDANGKYTLNAVPVGRYALTASAVQNNAEYSNGLQGQVVELTAANPNATADIALSMLPADFRDLEVICQVTSCGHSDFNPFHQHGVLQGVSNTFHIQLGPGTIGGSCEYSYDYGKGGYFTVSFLVSATLAQDLSVQVSVLWTIKDDGSGNIQNSNAASPLNFTVAKDGMYSGSLSGIEAKGDLYTNGPANFTIVVYNNAEKT